MSGVPSAISSGPWWWIFLFLLCVVFLRAQATYWIGRGLRRGAAGSESQPQRRAGMARRFSGPAWQRAQDFVEKWGFVAIPVSFLTIGFQTLVNAAAGFTRMRWDLYTAAMIPGCAAWAAVYSVVGFSLVAAWKESPWLFVAVVVALVGVAWLFSLWRRRSDVSPEVRTEPH
ncbi:DedA family protein [Demequina sp.]|uniref:DedA family protein n=1 Tax=Demequina sp. TaxID=2050685 RepID=UPI003D106BBD